MFTIMLLAWVNIRVDESGVPFWLSGSLSSFMAVPQQPGWYMPTQFYYYSDSADASKTFRRGASTNLGLSLKAASLHGRVIRYEQRSSRYGQRNC